MLCLWYVKERGDRLRQHDGSEHERDRHRQQGDQSGREQSADIGQVIAFKRGSVALDEARAHAHAREARIGDDRLDDDVQAELGLTEVAEQHGDRDETCDTPDHVGHGAPGGLLDEPRH